MKRIFACASLALLIVACGGNSGQPSGTDTTATTTTPAATDTPAAAAPSGLSDNPDYQKGLELIAQSDCLTCHKVEEKFTGPAYREVANKYENDPKTVTMLAEKIIKGGSGVWGAVPMTAHATLSQADAEQMVKYIMLLKEKK